MKWTSWQGLALAFALVTGAGCGKGGQQASQPADTAGGDLMLARPESAAALNDVPAPGATPPAAAPTPAPTRAGRRAPAPERTAPSARQPAAPSSYTAAAGTRVPLAVTEAISSRTAQAGQEFTATVRSDVTDAAGHVVIPAGSTVTGTISEVKSGGAKNAGTLTLAVRSLTVRGSSYPIEATVESATTIQQGRGVTGTDAAKVGAGAAAGAIAGRIIGKNNKGTIIGGILGAAAGTGVARVTRTVDIVLPAGADVEIALSSPLTVRAR